MATSTSKHTTSSSSSSSSSSFSSSSSSRKAVDFEVFGKVQGVFFRKYTKQKADELRINGFVYNDESGTVKGHAQTVNNSTNSLETFVQWLCKEGSPKSRIDKCEVKEVVITANTPVFKGFEVRK